MPTDTGSGGVQAKKAKLAGIGKQTISGSGGVQAKKPALQGLQREIGFGGVLVKKPSLHGGVSLRGSGGVLVKKPALFGQKVVIISGSGGVTVKKPFIFSHPKNFASGGVTVKKPSLHGLRRTLVAVRVNGLWVSCVVKARINGAWVVPVTTKVMLNGSWFTVGLDSEGLPRSHGNMFVKKPSLAGHASIRVSGSGGVTVKKPFVQGAQHFTVTGSGGVLHKKASLKGNGKPSGSAMLVGVNNYTGGGANTFTDYSSVIPNCTVTRFYNQGSDGPNGIPSAWPSAPIPSGAIHYVVSIRPTDLNGFIAGTYDAATKVWLRKIPAGHFVCCYHEANLAANIFQTTLHGTPTQFKAMALKLKALAVAVQAESPGNPKVNVGIIIGSANVGIDNTPWVPPGLDWYGMDGYGGAKSVLPSDRFGPNIASILSVQPGATMAIIENNDKTAVNPARWDLWFTDCFNLAQSYNMVIFMTWWGPTAQYPNAELFNTSGTYVPNLQALYASV